MEKLSASRASAKSREFLVANSWSRSRGNGILRQRGDARLTARGVSVG
jgi:hypothetical protein